MVSGKTSAETISGPCGDTAQFVYDSEGTLTITGTGKVDVGFLSDYSKKISDDKIYKIIIGEGITELDTCCFGYFLKVEEVQLPSTLRIMNSNCMGNMYALKKIELPDGLEFIGKQAFTSCSKVESVKIPDSVTHIEDYAFEECRGLKSVKLPKNLTELKTGTFENCWNIKSIVLPQKLKKIGEYVFEGCSNLNMLVIPDSVEEIGTWAFGNCERLKNLVVGKSVKKVGKNNTAVCRKLRKVENHSKISLPLYIDSSFSWFIGKKKVKKVTPGKTVYAKGKRYLVKYLLNGGKVSGKLPKYHVFDVITKLPKPYRKGYTFLGWKVYGNYFGDDYTNKIDAEAYGKLKATGCFKKIQVSSKNGKIFVMVRDCSYGTKGYSLKKDHFYYRYSLYNDMRESKVVYRTAPYGKGLSVKLIKGKTYYIQIAEMDGFEEYNNGFDKWILKRKVKVK
jgi:hypothetical protein